MVANYDVVLNSVTSSVAGQTFQKIAEFGQVSLWIGNFFATAVSQTVTANFAATCNGCTVMTCRVSGMKRTGAQAAKQSATGSGSGGTSPSCTFGITTLTGNPTIGVVGNATNPCNITPNASWIEGADTGFAVPTRGAEYATRDSGFVGTAFAAWGLSGSAWEAVAVELDTSEPEKKKKLFVNPGMTQAVHRAAVR
jgi:hypothetical protein